MMKPEIEDELRDYMREQRQADMAGALRRIFEHLAEHERKDDVRHAEILGQLRGHSLRLGELEASRKEFREDLRQSGSWMVEDLREQAGWWRKNSLAFVAVVVSIAAGILSAIKR